MLMPLAYALIHREAGVFGLSFPDFPGVIATGRTAEDAIRKGTEALTFHVAGMVEDGDPLPALRSLDELERDPEYRSDAEDAVVAMVPFDLPAKAVRVNISLDEHLLAAIDRAAAAEGRTRSGFLADAARMKIRS
jgi:predicted RNase H-like HicB family nuclease